MRMNNIKSLLRYCCVLFVVAAMLLATACQMPSGGGSGTQGGSGEQGGTSGEEGKPGEGGTSGEEGKPGEGGTSGEEGKPGEGGNEGGEQGGSGDTDKEDKPIGPSAVEFVGLFDVASSSMVADWLWVTPGTETYIAILFKGALPESASVTFSGFSGSITDVYATVGDDMIIDGERYSTMTVVLPAFTEEGEFAAVFTWSTHSGDVSMQSYRLTVDDALDNPSGAVGVFAGAAVGDYWTTDGTLFVGSGVERELKLRYTAPVSNLVFSIHSVGIVSFPINSYSDGGYTVYVFNIDTTLLAPHELYYAEITHGSTGADWTVNYIEVALGDDGGENPEETRPTFLGVSLGDGQYPEGSVVSVPAFSESTLYFFFDKEVTPYEFYTDCGIVNAFTAMWSETGEYFIVIVNYPEMPEGSYKATLSYTVGYTYYSDSCGVDVVGGPEMPDNEVQFLGARLEGDGAYSNEIILPEGDSTIELVFYGAVYEVTVYCMQHDVYGAVNGIMSDDGGYYYVTVELPSLKYTSDSVRIEYTVGAEMRTEYVTLTVDPDLNMFETFLGASNYLDGVYGNRVEGTSNDSFTVYVKIKNEYVQIYALTNWYEETNYSLECIATSDGYYVYRFELRALPNGFYTFDVYDAPGSVIGRFTVTVPEPTAPPDLDVSLIGAMTPEMIGPMTEITLYTDKENEMWLVFDGEVSYASIDIDGERVDGYRISDFNGYTTYSFIVPRIMRSDVYKVYVAYNDMNGNYGEAYIELTAYGVIASFEPVFYGAMLTPDGIPNRILAMTERLTDPFTIYLAFEAPIEIIGGGLYIGGQLAMVGESFKYGDYYLLPITVQPITSGIHHNEHFTYSIVGYPDTTWECDFEITVPEPTIVLPEFLGVKVGASDTFVTADLVLLPGNHTIRFVYSGPYDWNYDYNDVVMINGSETFARYEQIDGGFEAIVELPAYTPGIYEITVEFDVANGYSMVEKVFASYTANVNIDKDPVFFGAKDTFANNGYSGVVNVVYGTPNTCIMLGFDSQVYIYSIKTQSGEFNVADVARPSGDEYVYDWYLYFDWLIIGENHVTVNYSYLGVEYSQSFTLNVDERRLVGWYDLETGAQYSYEALIECECGDELRFMLVYNFLPVRVMLTYGPNEDQTVYGEIGAYDEKYGGYVVYITVTSDLTQNLKPETYKLNARADDGNTTDVVSSMILLYVVYGKIEVYGLATSVVDEGVLYIQVTPGTPVYMLMNNGDSAIAFRIYKGGELTDTIHASEISELSSGRWAHRIEIPYDGVTKEYKIMISRGVEDVNGTVYLVVFVDP